MLARSVRLAHQVGNRLHLAQALEALALFAAHTRAPEAAIRFASAAAAIRTGISAPLNGADRSRLEHWLESARQSVDVRTATRASDAGAAWSVEQATEAALRFPTYSAQRRRQAKAGVSTHDG